MSTAQTKACLSLELKEVPYHFQKESELAILNPCQRNFDGNKEAEEFMNTITNKINQEQIKQEVERY